MSKIKIISNPYKREIGYETFVEQTGEWADVAVYSPNGKLREESVRRCFLPFKSGEILDIIVDEYYLENRGPVELVFEGTNEEYNVLRKYCDNSFAGKLSLVRSEKMLDNGKFILNDTKEMFVEVKPVIEDIAKDEFSITKNLLKVSDALDDIVPICVFGNCSAGKSTFINSLIGREVLPNGGDPVTAKAFKIQSIEEEEQAEIRFTHWDDEIELLFKDGSYVLQKGNPEDEMLKELDDLLNETGFDSLNKVLLVALEFINDYEKKDSTSTEIGNMVELYLPFRKSGILGSSENKYVIFDTPGSNTASNDAHIEVLKEALKGFSNGIPVWVSQYEAVDSMDNEALCNDILEIEALDQRFTMIVLNKADVSDLPEKGFSDKQIKNILEFRSVEKMYSGGLFFVSSIMGLGAKNDGVLSNKFYKKIYRFQEDSFADPEDDNYMRLYTYNILPSQIKQEIVEYYADKENDIYVNSGLHCIEYEIEEFASKYSAYNKCQMVYALLSDVVDKTTEKIEKSVEKRMMMRDKYIGDLEDKKRELINEMRDYSMKRKVDFLNESYDAINNYVRATHEYNYTMEQLEAVNKKYDDENTEQYNLDDFKLKYEEAKSKSSADLRNKLKEFKFKEIKKSFGELVDDRKKHSEDVDQTREAFEKNKKDAYAETVDEVLSEVVARYNDCMSDAIRTINVIACNYWKASSDKLKKELVDIVTASDVLTEKQKELLANIIFNYETITVSNNAQSIFEKPRFLHGRLLGMDLFTYEKLNVGKLLKEYNKTIDRNVEKVCCDMNVNYFNYYKKWQDELSMLVEKNIVELNPELQMISEAIDDETEKINYLEMCQQKIKTSLDTIVNLISFKVVE